MSSNNVDRKTKKFEDTEFDILWEGKPCGLWKRFLNLFKMNFTTYQITNDELIVITGFFKRKVNTCELYLLKDPDLTSSLYQRMIGVSTVSVRVDSKGQTNDGKIITLKNIKEGMKVRKLLRDAIEDDVSERKIQYFDRV